MLAIGCSDNDNKTDKTADPDNTKVNQRDAEGNTATAFDQSNDQADIDLVAKIRERVVDVDDMSVKGQNVKIITNNGNVILRGPVASAAEKEAIEKIATDAAGAGKVTSNLEVDED
jgi:osmotically-inducible protein OsmY